MPFPSDIYSEPEHSDDTLANLGPLRGIAGVWEGKHGLDVPPKPLAPERQEYVERIELQPIDPQLNGPQIFYGLRYHTRIVKPGEIEMYHEQVGHWLWEPATGTVIQTLSIPRGQAALAVGHSTSDAKRFELTAKRGETVNGILSNPFIEDAFHTLEFNITVEILSADSWRYDEDTIIAIRGQAEPFHHTDHAILTRIAPPLPNPLALGRAGPDA